MAQPALEREQVAAREMQLEAALEQARAAALQQGAGLEQDDAVGQPPRSNQMQQESDGAQLSGDSAQHGMGREQTAQQLEQLEAERTEPVLEYTPAQSWGMEL